MKKILTILLALLLVFTLFACDKGEEVVEEEGISWDDVQPAYVDGEGNYIFVDQDGNYYDADLNPFDISTIDVEDEDMGQEYDFEFDMNKTFKMDDVLETMGTGSLQDLESKILEKTGTIVKEIFGSEFELDSSYNEGSGDEVVGAYGYEDGDQDKRSIEVGIYKTGEPLTYEYYISFASEIYLDATDDTLTAVQTELKNAYGISVSKEKLKTAVEQILATDIDNIYDIYFYCNYNADRDLYEDNVSFSVCGCALNDTQAWYYGVNIDRMYD